MHRVAASIKALECHTRDPRLCGTAARFASTNISKEFSGGLFSWLTGGTFHQLPPQDVKIPDPFPYYEDPRRTKITTLENGVRIASTPAPVMGPFVPIMAEVLIDCVRNPVFLDQEIAEQVQKIKTEIEEAAANDPHSLLLEALHSTAFSGALANPLLASESSICRLNSAVLEEFVAENYTAPRMVLAGLGADHWKVVSIAEKLLSDLPKVVRPEEPKSVYVGGEYRCQAESSNAHVALAFEVPGGWENEKAPLTLPVLQMLVGGGGSFSAGFLGREMYSNKRVLNEFPQIKAFSAFSRVYKNTGLFGIQATSSPAFVSKTIDLAARELLALASSGQVDQGELDQAKASTRSAVLTNLYGKLTVEDIGRQILAYGKRKPIGQFLKFIDDITVEDIVCLTKKIVSSPLTMASWGDVRHVPSYESVSSKFRSL